MEDLKTASSYDIESYELSNSKNPNKDVDAELQAFAIDFAQHDPEWHAYKTKHLLKKIDFHLLPWIVLMCKCGPRVLRSILTWQKISQISSTGRRWLKHVSAHWRKTLASMEQNSTPSRPFFSSDISYFSCPRIYSLLKSNHLFIFAA